MKNQILKADIPHLITVLIIAAADLWVVYWLLTTGWAQRLIYFAGWLVLATIIGSPVGLAVGWLWEKNL